MYVIWFYHFLPRLPTPTTTILTRDRLDLPFRLPEIAPKNEVNRFYGHGTQSWPFLRMSIFNH